MRMVHAVVRTIALCSSALALTYDEEAALLNVQWVSGSLYPLLHFDQLMMSCVCISVGRSLLLWNAGERVREVELPKL